MRSFGVKARTGQTLLKGGVSMVALTALAATLVAPAYAQDTTEPAASDDTAQEVVVVGVRKALKSAQDIKKNADTVVDSITANDIGSFPDKSVAEALQRVAGITVNRFAATGDTAHFSAEPSGVVVRGLQQVRSEFNGRDIFTADSSRGLSWSDVSPELMGGVDVYKNQTADLIEGGIAGTISLRTRLPFDQKGRVLAATAEYTYGDLVKKGAGTVSGIYADRWDTSAGEFGFMINGAHSEIYTNSEGVALGRMVPVVNSYWGDTNRRYMPMTTALRDNTYYRVRDGISLAGQWQNHDHTMVATLQYNQSKKREQWEEYVATSSTGVDAWAQPINYVYTSDNVQCLGGVSNCTFDDNGFIQSGTLVNGNGAWYGSWTAPDGATSPNGLMRTCYSWEASATCPASQRAGGYANDTRWSDSLNDTKDISFNFKWDVSERLKTNFDIQYVDAVQTNYDISTELATYADVALDFTGDVPQFTIDNAHTEGWYLAPGGIANPANYRQHFIMDHVTDSDGHEFATRADLAYSFDSPWLNTLKAGVRYADREQTVRWTTYNWASVVNNWSNYDADNYYITGSAFPDQNAYGIHTFDSHFYGGDVTNITDGVFFNINNLKDRTGLANTFDATHYQPRYTDGTLSNQWTPICHRAGEDSRCFLPAEIADVSEKTKAAYVQLKFGGPDATIFNGVTVVGNIGVRYVETDNASAGGVNYHNTTVYDTDPIVPADPVTGAPAHPSLSYYVSAEDRAFAGTVDTNTYTVDVTHKNWLPSFNVRFGLTPEWFVRFAASKAMSRPDIGNLKYYTSVSMALPSTSSLSFSDYNCTSANSPFNCDSSGNIVSTKTRFTANANNPYLKPITADQFDLSIENYFSQTGSFTFTGFYKQFHDYITYGKYVQNFTNSGVTRPVEVSGPVNASGGAIKGFEVAYQTFFDNLPSPWNGLGIQANFTKLKNDGIESTGVVTNSGDGSSGQAGGGTSVAALGFTKLPLEGLSDTTYNLIGMFEKGKWSARLAYNWRSKYLVTRQDCCVALPIWQRAAGFLDGRVAYRINDNVEMSLEGTNLLSTETVLMQQVDGPMSDGTDRPLLLLPNAWFKNDRRIQAQIRLKY